MAEVFNNYLVSIPFSNSNKIVTIVPKQGSSLPIEGDTTVLNAIGTRTAGSTSQIHSIYLTKSDQNSYSDAPENDSVKLSISVYDTTYGTEYYIAKYVLLLPNSSFYIEKTITLKPQDSIRLTYHGTASVNVDAVCSGVDLK